jgi:hypothetical protein
MAATVAPTLFISYRHASPTTDIAARLREQLLPAAEGWNAEVFLDDNALEPSSLLDRGILAALNRTTHFIVLLTSGYWASAYCRLELARAIERFENKENIRLLFVLAQKLDPKHYITEKDRAAGRITSDDPLIARLSDIVFLGPFNAQRQLVRLEYEHPAVLDDQLADLIARLERVI